MASGVNVKMGVSGIAQFKQSITQAKTSIKTLDAQLALTEKQYKATGDAETYMQQKTEQLQSKMEAQRAIVENAEKALKNMKDRGVDMNSKAFQDMVQQLARANADLLDTQMQMQGVETAADNSAAAVGDMATELSSIGSQVSFQTVIQGLDNIADGIQHAVTKAYELGKALFLATLDSASWADEINTAAQKAGMSTKEYQQMAAAAEQVDTSIDSVIGSQQKLAQAAENDGEEMQKIFARLGVQRTRYGEVRDLKDLFWETGEALMKIDNEADRSAMGKKLFGQWRELIPMFEMGREKYEELRESQTYVDEEHMKSLQSLDDSYKDMQHQIEVLKHDFFAELAPSIQTVTDALSGLLKRFNEYLKSDKGQEMMKSLGDNIEKLFSSVANFDPEEAVKKIGDVMGAIESGFQWISDNWESVQTGLLAIAGGWAAIKVATFGLKIGELVTGLKGLPFFGGGGNSGGGTGTGTGTETTTGISSLGLSGVGGLAGIAAIGAGFNWAIDRRRNSPELVRGTNENFAAEVNRQSTELQTAFVNYIKAQKALEDYELTGEYNEEKIDKLYEAANAAQEALYGLENHEDILKAYSDWRQEHSYGNMDWVLPDNETLEALMGSYDRMTDETEDLTSSTKDQTKASNTMTQAAENLMNLPGMVEDAVYDGMSNVKIYIDGQQAGTAVAPYVDGALGGVLALVRS